MTKAERYAEFCKNFMGAPTFQLDDRWRANVTTEGGLQLRQDNISKGKLSPEAVGKLFEFIDDIYMKPLDFKKKEKK